MPHLNIVKRQGIDSSDRITSSNCVAPRNAQFVPVQTCI